MVELSLRSGILQEWRGEGAVLPGVEGSHETKASGLAAQGTASPQTGLWTLLSLLFTTRE